MSIPRLVVLTGLALVAFAGNSLLCRAALLDGRIDPLGFTGLRLIGGAVVLAPWAWAARREGLRTDPLAAGALLGYALCFSMAYVRLDAGVGALLLFGTVQVVMVGAGWLRGERVGVVRWVGLAVAAAGLLWLVAAGGGAELGLGESEAAASGAMALAGVGWALYSLRGRGVRRPTWATAQNFALLAPAGLLMLAFALPRGTATPLGVGLALSSGALTSGLGYVVWYTALPGLSRSLAAIVQLAVPVIAAGLGALLLDERLGPQRVGAGLVTLAGVALALLAGRRREPGPQSS